ncbi:hypothetical protein D3C78_1696220 [compost metagenome]
MPSANGFVGVNVHAPVVTFTSGVPATGFPLPSSTVITTVVPGSLVPVMTVFGLFVVEPFAGLVIATFGEAVFTVNVLFAVPLLPIPLVAVASTV